MNRGALTIPDTTTMAYAADQRDAPMTNNHIDDLHARRWGSATELLSLDFVRPFYEHLGVEIYFEETLRGVLRDVLMQRFDTKRKNQHSRIGRPRITRISFLQWICCRQGLVAK